MVDHDRMQQQRLRDKARQREQDRNRAERKEKEYKRVEEARFKEKKKDQENQEKRRQQEDKIRSQLAYNIERDKNKSEQIEVAAAQKIAMHEQNLELKERFEENKNILAKQQEQTKIGIEVAKQTGSKEQMLIGQQIQERLKELDFNYFVERENVFEQSKQKDFDRRLKELSEVLQNTMKHDKLTQQLYEKRLEVDSHYRQREVLLNANIEKALIKHRAQAEIAIIREQTLAESELIEIRKQTEHETMELQAVLQLETDEQAHIHNLEMETKRADEDIRKNKEKGIDDVHTRQLERKLQREERGKLYASFDREAEEKN